LLLLLPAAPVAFAAESYDACGGFIDSLPATLSSQGTWCLRKDLSTAIAAGTAITIATNNVTIDCNGFKLGGLSGGPQSEATGVSADKRLNAIVRNCTIRGFRVGVSLAGSGSGGHLVEDNRFDQVLALAIDVQGDGNLVQRNRIFDTGSATGDATAIHAAADIRDNTIEGIFGANTAGIRATGRATEVSGNRIRNLTGTSATGVFATGGNQSVLDNRIMGPDVGRASGAAIHGNDQPTYCRGNITASFSAGLYLCQDNGGNVLN